MRNKPLVLSIKILAFSFKHIALSYKQPKGEEELGLMGICGLALPKEGCKVLPFFHTFINPSGELVNQNLASSPERGRIGKESLASK